MTENEGPVELLQGGIVAFICGYLLLKFLDVFPSGEVSNGQFGDAYWIFSLMPWLLFLLGIVLLLTMVKEVVKF